MTSFYSENVFPSPRLTLVKIIFYSRWWLMRFSTDWEWISNAYHLKFIVTFFSCNFSVWQWSNFKLASSEQRKIILRQIFTTLSEKYEENSKRTSCDDRRLQRPNFSMLFSVELQTHEQFESHKVKSKFIFNQPILKAKPCFSLLFLSQYIRRIARVMQVTAD